MVIITGPFILYLRDCSGGGGAGDGGVLPGGGNGGGGQALFLNLDTEPKE